MEPIKQPPTPPQIPSTAPQKRHFHVLQRVQAICLAIIKKLGELFLRVSQAVSRIFKKPVTPSVSKPEPELLPIKFVKPKPRTDMEPLREAHFRFHRLELDPEHDFPGFGILDGETPFNVFEHVLRNWCVVEGILRDCSPSPSLGAKIESIATILHQSDDFFSFQGLFKLSPQQQGKMAASKGASLQEGKCLILPGGTYDHTILYEIKKEKGKWYLKIYNAGEGTEFAKERERFIVPCYAIEDKNSIKRIMTELYALLPLTVDKTTETKGILYRAIEKIVTSHGGKRLPSEETHRLQDRGNCSWKAISTWFREQTSTMEITITQQMVDKAGRYLPYAQKTLAQLVGKQINLNRFFKIIGYEQMRSILDRLFFTQVGSQPSPKIEEEREYKIYETPIAEFEASKEGKKAKEYLSALAKRIHKESAIERYGRKDLNRKRIKT